MATDTYLELVSDMITETGLTGGNAPSSVASADGDAGKVAYWVRIADLQIQRERIDWDFLWQEQSVNLTQDSSVVPAPPLDIGVEGDVNSRTMIINAMAKDRLGVIDGNGEVYFPVFLDWNEFSVVYNYVDQVESDFPSHWSIRPDRTILLSNPIQSSGMTCKYEFWRKPIRMRTNTDTSRIPDDFSRLIVLLAKVLYAEHEDAPEVEAGASAQYDMMLNQMITVHSPMAEWQRMENSDRYLQVETR
jgi:hypothetical protein